jgi:hypothetical protein
MNNYTNSSNSDEKLFYKYQSLKAAVDDDGKVKKDDELVKLLRVLIRTGPDNLNEIRFTENVINGVLIEDALIYRMTL